MSAACSQVRMVSPSPRIVGGLNLFWDPLGLMEFIYAGSDRTVRFYDVAADGTQVATLTLQAVVLSMCWVKTFNSPHSLACLCSDGDIHLWRLDSHYIPASNARHTVINAKNGVLAEGIVAFHADGNRLAIGFPGKITVWGLSAECKCVLFGPLVILCKSSTRRNAGLRSFQTSTLALHSLALGLYHCQSRCG